MLEHRPTRRAADSGIVSSPNIPTYRDGLIQENQTDGESGKYENKQKFIGGFGSKKCKRNKTTFNIKACMRG